MSEGTLENYWHLIEPIWEDDKLYSEIPEIYLERFEQLTEPQKVLFPTHWLYSEINNGGFHQCFSNDTGMFAPEAVVGFNKLGLTENAQIVQEAISLFGDNFPRIREKRWDFLDSFSGEKREEYDPFFQIDDKFYLSFEIEGISSLVNDKFLVAAIEYARNVSN